MKHIILLAILAFLTISPGLVAAADGTQPLADTARIGEKAPDFTLTDSNGKTHSLSDFAGKTVLLEWINFDCPFVRKHYDTENMQRLQKTYVEKGVVWLSINSSAPGKQGYFDADALKERVAKEKTHATAYLVDSDGTVGKRYGAKTTPHIFIINSQGILTYAGAIDDKPSTRKDTVEGADNYVEKALDAILNGQDPPVKTTVSYGCSVKY